MVVLLSQFLEELIPLARQYQGVAGGFAHLADEVHWPRFLATHAILKIFLGIYCFISELVGIIGGDSVQEALFVKAPPAA